MTEIYQGESTRIANALRTVGINVAKASDTLSEYGVEVYDTNGELNSTYKILEQLYPAWQEMSDAEKVSLGNALAGKTRYGEFSAVMNNFEHAISACETAMNSEGETLAQNEAYMESFEAQLTNLQGRFERLFIDEDGSMTSMMEGIFDVGNALLDFAEKIDVVKSGLTALIGIIAVSGATALANTLASMGVISTVMSGFVPIIGAVAIALTTIGVTAWSAYQKAEEEAIAKAQEYEEAHLGITENSSTDEIVEQILRISDAWDKATLSAKSYEEVKEILDEETRSLEEQEEAYEELYAQMQKQLTFQSQYEKGSDMWSVYQQQINATKEKMEQYSEAHSKNNAILENEKYKNRALAQSEAELEEAKSNSASTTREQIELSNELGDSMSDLSSSYQTLQSAIEEYNEQGSFSASTIQKLLSLDPAYLNCLQEENGLYSINQEALNELTNAKVEEEKQTIMQTAYNRLLALTQEDTADSSEDEAESTDILADSISNLTDKEVGLLAVEQARKGYGSDVQEIMNDMQNQIDLVEKLGESIDAITGNSSSDSKTSSSSSSTDTHKEEFEARKKALEHELEMEYITEQEYYDSLMALADEYYKGLSQYSEEYAEEEEEVYKGIKELYEDAIDAQVDALEDAIDNIEEERDAIVDALEDEEKARKKALEAEEKEALANIKSQIEALEDQRDAEEEYWNAKIEALEEENEQIEEQNKLMEYQQALAEAKATKVKVMGEDGKFTYTEDEEAVSEAEQDIYEYEQQLAYEKELQELEDSRDSSLAILDQKIEDLNDYYDQVQDNYDAQLEALEEYYETRIAEEEANYQLMIDNYQSYIDNIESQSQALLDTQTNVLNGESANWQLRLANLQTFVNQYNSMLSQLGIAGSFTNYDSSAIKGQEVSAYATGTSSVKDDEIALVGDNPNYSELVIGSKLNNDTGILTNLKAGTGVVNAESTQTLAGLFNGLTSTTSGGIINNNSNTNSSSAQSITIGSISLPQVENGNDFINYLKNFSLDITQRNYSFA